MANNKVPWTTPGEPSCCCDPCPTTENGPDATYSPGTWSNIFESDYNALLAGGTFTLDLSLSISGTSSEFPSFVETATANYVDIPLETRSSVNASLPCFNQLVTADPIFSNHELEGPGTEGTPIEQRLIEINFTYALAIVSGVRRLSLANATNAQGQGQNRFVAALGSIIGLDLPGITYITVSNPAYIDPWPQATAVSASVALVMPSATYSSSNIARVVYFYPDGLTGTVTGTFNMTVRYSPSAP